MTSLQYFHGITNIFQCYVFCFTAIFKFVEYKKVGFFFSLTDYYCWIEHSSPHLSFSLQKIDGGSLKFHSKSNCKCTTQRVLLSMVWQGNTIFNFTYTGCPKNVTLRYQMVYLRNYMYVHYKMMNLYQILRID